MLFYPSHDIALAHGVRHFNPPAAALRLQEDLASLSHIWNAPYEAGEVPFPQPWGWDWDTRRHLHDAYGVKMSQLPTDEQLELIRQLSSRRTTIELQERLASALEPHEPLKPFEPFKPLKPSLPLPSFLTSPEAVESFIAAHDSAHRPFVLKTPWSSSGRGLTRSDVPRETLLRHAQATIQRMGGIMGEEWIEDKRQDFAMLFFASDHDVRFQGYSLFDNDGTTYRQGYLMSDERIVERLGIEPHRLEALSKAYVTILSELFAPFFGHGWQLGYVGIDMMTYGEASGIGPATNDSLCIAPCVEMNLRCTMGVVCRLWYDKHQQEGIFRISPMAENGHFRAEFLTDLTNLE